MVSSPATLGPEKLGQAKLDNGQAVHLCWMRTDAWYYRADGLSYIYIYNSTCPATFSRNYLSCQPAALGGMTKTLEDNFSSYLLPLILIILIWICAGDDQQFVKTPLNRNHWLEGPRCPAPPNQPLSCFIIGDTYEDSFRSSYYIISL